jgi:hypothetical protein
MKEIYGVQNIPWLGKLAKEISQLEPVAAVPMPDADVEFDYVMQLAKGKVRPLCKTNADGWFNFSLAPKLGLEYFIMAREERKVGTDSELYRWIKPLDLKQYAAGEREIILSNDAQINLQENLAAQFGVPVDGVSMTSADALLVDSIRRTDPRLFITELEGKVQRACADFKDTLQRETQGRNQQQAGQRQREEELSYASDQRGCKLSAEPSPAKKSSGWC